jgi:hypothetical protein
MKKIVPNDDDEPEVCGADIFSLLSSLLSFGSGPVHVIINLLLFLTSSAAAATGVVVVVGVKRKNHHTHTFSLLLVTCSCYFCFVFACVYFLDAHSRLPASQCGLCVCGVHYYKEVFSVHNFPPRIVVALLSPLLQHHTRQSRFLVSVQCVWHTAGYKENFSRAAHNFFLISRPSYDYKVYDVRKLPNHIALDSTGDRTQGETTRKEELRKRGFFDEN